MIHPNAYKTGLIAAGITIAYTLIAYLIAIDLFTNFWIPMLVVVGILVYMILSLKKIRENLGFMSFKDGFLNFAVMAVLYVFISPPHCIYYITTFVLAVTTIIIME